MSKFKKKSKANPAISTASLPDIVFMLLFFFMVTTVLRDTDILVNQKIPQATQIQKLEKKSLVSYLYVGKPKKANLGTEAKIQANDVFIEPKGIVNFVENEKAKLAEYERNLITISLKVDTETKMGIITDIKQELRNANALKLNYTSIQKMKE
jgi:biopolymer transport protein ExbD